MNIPLNRWTVGAAIALIASLGPDFLSAIMRAVFAVGGAYVPAA
jgi:hypothetical protein